MLRTAFLVISALTTGVSLGRKAIDTAVERKKQSIIDQAAKDARERIRHHAELYLRNSITQFVQAVFIKTLLLVGAWIAYRTGLVPHTVLSLIVGALLLVFVIRDFIVFFPTGRMIASELHTHGWHPKRAVSETVAALVFEQVLTEAGEIKTGRVTQIMLALSGHKMDNLTQEVAGKVSAIAKETSWQDLRPFMLAAAGKFVVLSALYSTFVFILLHSA
ncbi:MAG: hypothetical protein WA989_18095 [Henriciella sp.]|uniref:hypothetical protein n=1 Tax=Henriciella sp. TaxID=1968823 RepID=UPI003C76A13F